MTALPIFADIGKNSDEIIDILLREKLTKTALSWLHGKTVDEQILLVNALNMYDNRTAKDVINNPKKISTSFVAEPDFGVYGSEDYSMAKNAYIAQIADDRADFIASLNLMGEDGLYLNIANDLANKKVSIVKLDFAISVALANLGTMVSLPAIVIDNIRTAADKQEGLTEADNSTGALATSTAISITNSEQNQNDSKAFCNFFEDLRGQRQGNSETAMPNKGYSRKL